MERSVAVDGSRHAPSGLALLAHLPQNPWGRLMDDERLVGDTLSSYREAAIEHLSRFHDLRARSFGRHHGYCTDKGCAAAPSGKQGLVFPLIRDYWSWNDSTAKPCSSSAQLSRMSTYTSRGTPSRLWNVASMRSASFSTAWSSTPNSSSTVS